MMHALGRSAARTARTTGALSSQRTRRGVLSDAIIGAVAYSPPWSSAERAANGESVQTQMGPSVAMVALGPVSKRKLAGQDKPQQDVVSMGIVPCSEKDKAKLTSEVFENMTCQVAEEVYHDLQEKGLGGTTLTMAMVAAPQALGLARFGDSEALVQTDKATYDDLVMTPEEDNVEITGRNGSLLRVSGGFEKQSSFPDTLPDPKFKYIPFSEIEGENPVLVMSSDGIPLHSEDVSDAIDETDSLSDAAARLLSESNKNDNRSIVITDLSQEALDPLLKNGVGLIFEADGHGRDGAESAKVTTELFHKKMAEKFQELSSQPSK